MLPSLKKGIEEVIQNEEQAYNKWIENVISSYDGLLDSFEKETTDIKEYLEKVTPWFSNDKLPKDLKITFKLPGLNERFFNFLGTVDRVSQRSISNVITYLHTPDKRVRAINKDNKNIGLFGVGTNYAKDFLGITVKQVLDEDVTFTTFEYEVPIPMTFEMYPDNQYISLDKLGYNESNIKSLISTLNAVNTKYIEKIKEVRDLLSAIQTKVISGRCVNIQDIVNSVNLYISTIKCFLLLIRDINLYSKNILHILVTIIQAEDQ